MYANHKDAEIRGAFSVSATGAISESLMDLRNSNRICDEFSVMAAGYGTKQISPTAQNGGFETVGGGGADVFADWVETVQGGTVISQTAVAGQFHSGTKAMKIVVDANGNLVGAVEQDTVMVIGQQYRVTLWAKGAAGGETIQVFSQGTLRGEFILTNAYALYDTGLFTTDAIKLIVMTKANAVNDAAELYIDDITLLSTTAFERTPTNLAADLEASLDGVHWTSIKAIAETDNGDILISAFVPVQNFRFNVTALTLVDATDYVTFSILAT